MVRLDRVDDLGALLVLLGELHAELDVAALHLVVDALAEIMQQTCALGQGDVLAELACQKAGDVGDFHRVVQHVLTVGGAELLAAEELDQLRMHAGHAGLEAGALAFALDDLLDLAAGLFDHVLDAGRMNAAVGDQLLQSDAGDLAADRIEGGDRDGLGGVVDDQIDAGDGFEGADVAALAADDAALHLVVGQGDHGDRRFGGVVGGAALDRGGDDLARELVGVLAQLVFDLLELHGGVVAGLGLHILNNVGLGFFLGKAGDLLQHLKLGLLDEVDLVLRRGHCLLTLADLLLLALVVVQLLVERLFLLLQTPLLLVELRAALLDFLFVFRASFMDLLFCLKKHFTLLALATSDGFVDHALGFFFRAADLLFRDLLAVGNAGKEENNGSNQKSCKGQDVI